jgi:hypothetical protein
MLAMLLEMHKEVMELEMVMEKLVNKNEHATASCSTSKSI